MERLRDWIVGTGIEEGLAEALAAAAAWLLVLGISLGAYFLTKRLVVRLVKAAIARTDTRWDNQLADSGVFDRLSHLVPALLLQRAGEQVLALYPAALAFIDAVIAAYLVLIGILVADALLTAVQAIYEMQARLSRRFQIKTVVQVSKLVVYFLGCIAVLAMLLGRSPMMLFSSLGAFTAVLMLVFRDSILGFVAGIQLSVNDMVRRGDWIEMPAHGADGDVIDVSLTTVKVQNWDKTISTIPTHVLVAESFKNWRGMSESGGRRIKRALSIDMTSIRFCDEEMLERFKRIRFISDYLDHKLEEFALHNAQYKVDEAFLVNARNLTNVGTFRAYVEAYLRNHPKIDQDMTFLVRQLAPSEHGLPIEIYVFSRDQDWVRYETLQADIFDHLLAVAPLFDLRVFQQPSGADLRALSPAAG
ncbi:MAG: mechanosensitive ion channel family protein [Acidobacteria bacterium]|nr:mechanosensitive ion channel family protein [Acidobacteriota bacterium]